MASESSSLLPSRKAGRGCDDGPSWSTWRLSVVALNTLTYIVGIMPIALLSPLVPIFETETSLDWTKYDTRFMFVAMRGMEAIGMLLLGPLADLCGGACAMSWYLICAAWALATMTLAHTSKLILAPLLVALLVRGVAWPAAVKATTAHLENEQWEVGICCLGMASRTGATLAAGFISVAAVWLGGWRSAVILVAVAACAFAIVMHLLHSRGGPEHGTEADSPVAEPASFGEAAERHFLGCLLGTVELFSDLDSVMVTVLICLQQPLWAFGDFLGAFAHDYFGQSPTASAWTAGAFPLGQILGLLLMLLVVVTGGRAGRRRAYHLMLAGGLGAAAVPLVILTCASRMSEETFAGLALLEGTLVVAFDYIPPPVWCMLIGRERRRESLYLSVMCCCGLLASAAWNSLLGSMRLSSSSDAFALEMVAASVCALASSVLVFVHIRRNPALFHSGETLRPPAVR